MRLAVWMLLAVAGLSPVAARQPAAPSSSPLEPAATGGLVVVDRALAKLTRHCRLLVIGAHPDDEDTALLSLVGTGIGGEAAYLSLSRGEGGQNLLGTELGEGLGLVRTGETLAARRLEGTRQYFTRAFDFGYTRSLDEVFERWPREILQEDAVGVMRRFKPQVLVAVFPADERAGHGQHQAAGVLAIDLFTLGEDPDDRFPELTAVGLPPWSAATLYRRVWWGGEEATHPFSLAAIDPFSGRSLRQVAAASRSMHRSQDMGTLQPLGRGSGGLRWLGGKAAPSTENGFMSVDTRLAALASHLPEGELRTHATAQLQRIATLAEETRRTLAPLTLDAAVDPLVRMVMSLRELVAAVRGEIEGPAAVIVADLLEEKLEVAAAALAAAAGVAIDALSDRETVIPGASLAVTAQVWNSGRQSVIVREVGLAGEPGWSVPDTAERDDDPAAGIEQWRFEVAVATAAAPTLPYFVRRPRQGDLYDWRQVAAEVQGEPLHGPPLTARFALEIAGAPIQLEREVVYRYRDQALGEVRRPLRVVPAVEVAVEPELILWPRQATGSRTVEVTLRSNAEAPVRGRLELSSAIDWPRLAPRRFEIDEPRGARAVTLELPRPVAFEATRLELSAIAVLDDGRRFDAHFPVVQYPHVRPLPRRLPARVVLQMLDLELPDLQRVGYIRGASDRVPEILLEVGLPVEMLTAAALTGGDLSRFDVIVVGSRAYETEPVLGEVNSRLLQYVRDGGHLVVQYQQYQFVAGGYAPYPLEIGRPHGRVTDEEAPVRVLQPRHAIFVRPNEIADSDWRGWVQERGLYFAASWDPAYTPLLAMADAGQPEERGSLLVARLGRGTFVYTGLSFFRELPAGVPGALRLFVNLLAREGW